MLKLQEVKNIIDSIFSEEGYSVKGFNVKFPHPLDIKITRNKDDEISLDFTSSLPKVGWKKIINFTAWVQGISLGQDQGILKLKYLPDIKFLYSSEDAQLFSQTQQDNQSMYNFDDIASAIELEYEDEERRFLAKKCLHYASEWATITSLNGVNFASCDDKKRRQLKKDCKHFVIDNIRNDREIVAGSAIIAFLLIYIILPVVLKFIIEKLFKRLFG